MNYTIFTRSEFTFDTYMIVGEISIQMDKFTL